MSTIYVGVCYKKVTRVYSFKKVRNLLEIEKIRGFLTKKVDITRNLYSIFCQNFVNFPLIFLSKDAYFHVETSIAQPCGVDKGF